MEELKHY